MALSLLSSLCASPCLGIEQLPCQQQLRLQFFTPASLHGSRSPASPTSNITTASRSSPVNCLQLMAISKCCEQRLRSNILVKEVLSRLGTAQTDDVDALPNGYSRKRLPQCCSPASLTQIICQLSPETDVDTCASLLRRCTIEKSFSEGEHVHDLMIRSGHADNILLNNLLVQMYGRCGNLQYALAVFDNIMDRNLYSWTIMLSAFAQNGHRKEALQLFDQMQAQGFEPDKVTSICIMDACTGVEALQEAQEIHGNVVGNGWESDLAVGTALVNMYRKCRSLNDARAVFAEMPHQNEESQSAMIAACTQNGHWEEALQLFDQMQAAGFEPNRITSICVLDACASVAALEQGQAIHAHVVVNGWENDMMAGTAVLNMYGKCRRIDDAMAVFAGMPQQNVVSWNAMISACAQNGHGKEALKLFGQMQIEGINPDKITSIIVLDACAGVEVLEEGPETHSCVVSNGWESDVVVGNALVTMYGKYGSVNDSWSVFVDMPRKNIISWSAMIAAYAQNGHGKDALQLFSQMDADGLEPDKITFVCMLDACATVPAIEEGREIHARLVGKRWESDLIVATAVLHMYGKCKSLNDARVVFAEMPWRDVVSWSAMITVSVENGHVKEALQLLGQMQAEGFKPDKVTSICILDACASMAAIQEGEEIHANVVSNGWEFDTVVATALVNMYGKCGSLDDARVVFAEMPWRNVVSWSAMIAVTAQNGHGEEALQLFGHMQTEGIEPDKIISVCILDACASVTALGEGREMHFSVVSNGWESDIVMENALINMYGKCGSMGDARAVFAEMTLRDTVSWNAMMAVCARNGHGKEALQLFVKMQAEGCVPDNITFICVLTACSHMGLVAAGREFFDSMTRDHGIFPSVKHYVCMIDLLGRAGQLEKAEQLIDSMPFDLATSAGSSLLSACRIHGDMERGLQAANYVLDLDGENASLYVLLANLHAAAERSYAVK